MANRYFIDGGVDNDWSNTGNWSANSGDVGGETVPTSSDDVYLDANSPDCDIDANATVGSLNCTGYTNTLTMTATTYLLTYGNLTFVSGMTFTHNDQEVRLYGTLTLTSAGKEFGKLTFHKQETYTLADDITVTNDFTITTQSAGAYTINGNTINIEGDFYYDSYATVTGTTAFVVNGSSDQNIYGTSVRYSSLGNTFEVDSSGGTVYFHDKMEFLNTFTLTDGTIDFTTNTSTMVFSPNGYTITTNSNEYYNVTFGRTVLTGTITLADDMIIKNDCVFPYMSVGTTTLNGNKIYVEGNVTYSSYSTITGTTVLEVSGGNNQNWTQGSAYARYFGCPVIINKSGNTLTLVDSPRFGGGLTYTAGTVDEGTSTVWFSGSNTLNTDGIEFYGVNFYNNPAPTFTLGSDITVNNALTFSGGGARKITLNEYTIYAKGSITVSSATSAVGTTDLVINGTGAQTFTGNNGSSAYYFGLDTTVNKSDTLTFAGTSMTWNNADFIVTAGTIDASAFALGMMGTGTINTTATFLGFNIYNTTNKTLSSNLTCTGNITGDTSGSATFTTSSTQKTISFGGNFMLGIIYYEAGTGVKFIANGAGDQTMSSASQNRYLNPLLEIVKTTGIFTFGGVNEISLYQLTYTSGTVSAPQTVRFYTGDFDTNGITFSKVNVRGIPAKLTSALDINGTLQFSENTAILNANGKQVNCYDIDNNVGGTFTHENNTVIIDKPSGTATIDGSLAFYNFTCQIPGLTLEFDNTATYSIANNLTLAGSSGSSLILVSDSPTNQWTWTWNGASGSVTYVNVTDSDASAGNLISATDSIDGGNNDNWFITGALSPSVRTCMIA